MKLSPSPPAAACPSSRPASGVQVHKTHVAHVVGCRGEHIGASFALWVPPSVLGLPLRLVQHYDAPDKHYNAGRLLQSNARHACSGPAVQCLVHDLVST